MDRQINELREIIRHGQRGVVFSGAGISTESGIPDFRGPEGLWKTVTPIDFQEFVNSEERRRERWRRTFTGDNKMSMAQPNAGHLAVARLVQAGKVSHVITQNVDGLHQRAGVPDEQVIELHGNSSYAKCLDCDKRYEHDDLRGPFLTEGIIPMCSECGGIVKTATISFGQPMPVYATQMAEDVSLACDFFIVAGSSLVVYPAAGFPVIAKRNGAALVIINNEPTELDSICDLVIHQQIGPTMSAVVD